MKQIRFTLTYVLFWIILIFTGFLVENIALLTELPQEGLDIDVIYTVSILLLACSLVYFIVERKQNGFKLNYLLLIVLITLFVINLYDIWTSSDSYTYTNIVNEAEHSYTVYVTLNERITYSLQSLFNFTCIYILLNPYLKKQLSPKKNLWMYYAFVIYCLITIIASLYLDQDFYRTILTEEKTIYSFTKSFYTNANFYGFGLMLGVLALFIIQLHKPHWWSFWLMLIFLFFMIFTNCEAAIIISFTAIASYMFYSIVMGFRYYWKKQLIKIFLFALFTTVSFLICLSLYHAGNQLLVNINNFIIRNFITFGNHFDFNSSRMAVWNYTFEILGNNLKSWIIGMGSGLDSKLVHGVYMSHYINGNIYDIMTVHNAFLMVLVRGGLILLLAYVTLLIYFIYCIFYLASKKKIKNAFVYLVCFGCIILHGIVESTIFFECNASGIVITILFFIPALSEKYALTKQGKVLVEQVTYSPYFIHKIDSKLFTQMIATILTGCLLCLSILFPTPYAQDINMFYILANTVIGLIIAIIFVPYLVTLWYQNASKVHFLLRLFIYLILFVGVNIYSFIYFSNTDLQILIPIIYASSIILPFIIYMLFIKHASFKRWIVDTFKGVFAINWMANIFIIIFGSLFTFVLSNSLTISTLSLLVIIVFNIILYFLVLSISHSKNKSLIMETLNGNNIARMKRCLL